MEAAELLQTIGGPVGCRALSEAFYTRVKRDPVLRPFCPGASLRCVVEELTAFLVQLLDGPPEATQKRWLGQPRESHQRFCIDHAIELAEASAYIQQNRARHAALLGLLTTSDATALSLPPPNQTDMDRVMVFQKPDAAGCAADGSSSLGRIVR